jgi:multiple sugar transport system permease protein
MFTVLTVSAQMIVSFLLAVMFAKQFPSPLSLILVLPHDAPWSPSACSFHITINLRPDQPIDQSLERRAVHPVLQQGQGCCGHCFSDAWMWSPFVMLLVLAGLVSVPKYLYEAAAVDRVSKWRQFWTITFPYIRGLLMLALLFRTIEAFKLADMVILLTKGANDTMTVSYHLIRIANEQNKTSEGAAISYLMLFMVIVLTNLYHFANRRSRGA